MILTNLMLNTELHYLLQMKLATANVAMDEELRQLRKEKRSLEDQVCLIVTDHC